MSEKTFRDEESGRTFKAAWCHSKQFSEYIKAGKVQRGKTSRVGDDGVIIAYIVDDGLPEMGEYDNPSPEAIDSLVRRIEQAAIVKVVRE